jgi:hypothetical protein
MRTARALILVSLLALLALPVAGHAAAQRADLSRVKILAVAPFSDDVSFTRPLADWGAARLGELAARGRLQVVPPARVAEAMQRLGISRSELISPTKTITVGQAVGADAVVTGRIVFANTERDRDFIDGPLGGPLVSRLDVDVRVLEVGTRLKLFEDLFICEVASHPMYAMECIVRDVASRLIP